MSQMIFATGNQHKAMEVQKMMPSNYKILTLKDINFNEDIIEDGVTFEENAFIKAAHIYKVSKAKYIFAEDSGLEVDFLNGMPGLHTARYAGPQKDDNDNIDLLIKNLENVKDRSARFYACICLLIDGQPQYFDGHIIGNIAHQRSGKKGFGYDPIFIPEGKDVSFAELGDDYKNTVSHRKRALQKMIDWLVVREL